MSNQLIEKIQRNAAYELEQFFKVYQTWNELNSDGVKAGNALVNCISKINKIIIEERHNVHCVNFDNEEFVSNECIYFMLIESWRTTVDKLLYQYEKMLNIKTKLENFKAQVIVELGQTIAESEPILTTWSISDIVNQFNSLLNFFDDELCLKFEICNYFIEKDLTNTEDNLEISFSLSAWLHKPSLNSIEFQNVLSYFKVELGE